MKAYMHIAGCYQFELFQPEDQGLRATLQIAPHTHCGHTRWEATPSSTTGRSHVVLNETGQGKLYSPVLIGDKM